MSSMDGVGEAALHQFARSQFFVASPNEKGDTFVLKNALKISVKSGDITAVKATVIVVGEDESFSGRGAVAAKLIQTGGWEYFQNREHLKSFVREKGCRQAVYDCPAGPRLNFQQVFHALVAYGGRKDAKTSWDANLKNLFFQVGLLAEKNRVETFATPLLGAGNAGGSTDVSLEALVDGLSVIPLKNLCKVILVEYDSEKASDMKEKLRQILDRKRKWAEEKAERPEHSTLPRISGRRPYGPKSRSLSRDTSDWRYVNERGNSTVHLGTIRGRQNLNPDRPSHRGMQAYSADDSFCHCSQSEFVASSSIKTLPMPSRASDFSSFAHPTSGSVRQAIPNSKPGDEPKLLPDNKKAKKEPMAENQGPFAAGSNADNDADKGTNDCYQGEMKRIFRLHTTTDKSEESKEVLAQEIRAKILEEGQDKSHIPANRGQRKSKACRDGALEIPDSLKDQPPPRTSAGNDHDADFRFRGQRKSKVQVPREDADVSHQRSPSSPDPVLDRGLPLDTSTKDTRTTVERTEDTTIKKGYEDTSSAGGHSRDATTAGGRNKDTSATGGCTKDTSTTGEHTEETTSTEGHVEDKDQTRETAADTQPSEQDLGTESANRGQRKGKRATADGNMGSDSATTKFFEKKMLKKTTGTMPRGRMTYSVQPGIHVPGYESCGVIFVDYIVLDGIQTSEHPQPGSPYIGCSERAFLPDNDEGRRVLGLLEEAFDCRLTFQVCKQPGGQALVEWADIPHKTCLRGTRNRGGYPDPDYLGTVQNLLREKYGLE